MCARPTNNDVSLQPATGTGILPWFSTASLNLDPNSHENTISTLSESMQATAGAEGGDDLVDGGEDSDAVDSDFASSNSESDASTTSRDDCMNNGFEMQEDSEISKGESLGQWDEICKVESYPIVRAAGAPTKKLYLEDLNNSRERLNPWEPFANVKDYDLAKWFIEAGTTIKDIDSFFNRGLCGLPGSFSSSRDLKKVINSIV
jgi:hypothetical protein